MAYQVWIGVNDKGLAAIGANACDSIGAVRTERVYGSQLKHRVCARMKSTGKWRIVTPTEAMVPDYDVVKRIPGVDGYSRKIIALFTD